MTQGTLRGAQSGERKQSGRSGAPEPIDAKVGSRVRLRRKMLRLSQVKLADAMGLTFQQVQNYERGANQISPSRLHQLSRVLDVPVAFFFDDIDPVRAPAIPTSLAEPASEAPSADPLQQPESTELVNTYFAIEDAAVRRHLLALLKALVANVGASFAPEARVSEVARHTDVSSGQIYRWRQELRAAAAGFVQVVIAPADSPTATAARELTSCTELAIEVEFAGQARVRISGSIPEELGAAVAEALSRR